MRLSDKSFLLGVLIWLFVSVLTRLFVRKLTRLFVRILIRAGVTGFLKVVVFVLSHEDLLLLF